MRPTIWPAVSSVPDTLVTSPSTGWPPSSSLPTTKPTPATSTTATTTKAKTAISLATSNRVRADRTGEQVAQRPRGRLAGDRVTRDDRDRDRQEQRQDDRERGDREQLTVREHRRQERRSLAGPRADVRDRKQHGDHGRQQVEQQQGQPRARTARELDAVRRRSPVDPITAGRRALEDDLLERAPLRRQLGDRDALLHEHRVEHLRRLAVDDEPRRRPARRSGRRARRRPRRDPACGSACVRSAPAGRRRCPAAPAGRGRARRPGVHICSTSPSRWLDRNTVVPAAFRRSSNSRISRMPCGSRPFVGSSRISRRGRCSSAMAMPEPLPHAERERLHRLGVDAAEADVLAAPRRCAARGRADRCGRRSRRRSTGWSGPTGARRRPGLRPACRRRRAPAARRPASVRRTARPVPDVGSTSPSIIRTVVVLPEPFAPRKP